MLKKILMSKVLFGVAILGFLYFMYYFSPFPRIIEERVALKENGVLKTVEKTAKKLEEVNVKISTARDNLKKQGIYIVAGGSDLSDCEKEEKLLQQLLADNEAQKVFKKYGEKKIRIYFGDRYAIHADYVFINSSDNLKNIVKWLSS